MAFWQNIGRALQNIWETITHPESPPPPVEFEDEAEEPYEPGFGGYDREPPEYDQGPFGDFFGGDVEPESPPEGPFTYHEGDGPYMDDWGIDERRFWDEVLDGQVFEDAEQYRDAQDAFDTGFIDPDVDTDDRSYWRDEFLDIMDMIDFDWEAFREYYGYE